MIHEAAKINTNNPKGQCIIFVCPIMIGYGSSNYSRSYDVEIKTSTGYTYD